jgi:hypothetical protein
VSVCVSFGCVGEAQFSMRAYAWKNHGLPSLPSHFLAGLTLRCFHIRTRGNDQLPARSDCTRALPSTEEASHHPPLLQHSPLARPLGGGARVEHFLEHAQKEHCVRPRRRDVHVRGAEHAVLEAPLEQLNSLHQVDKPRRHARAQELDRTQRGGEAGGVCGDEEMWEESAAAPTTHRRPVPTPEGGESRRRCVSSRGNGSTNSSSSTSSSSRQPQQQKKNVAVVRLMSLPCPRIMRTVMSKTRGYDERQSVIASSGAVKCHHHPSPPPLGPRYDRCHRHHHHHTVFTLEAASTVTSTYLWKRLHFKLRKPCNNVRAVRSPHRHARQRAWAMHTHDLCCRRNHGCCFHHTPPRLPTPLTKRPLYHITPCTHSQRHHARLLLTLQRATKQSGPSTSMVYDRVVYLASRATTK